MNREHKKFERLILFSEVARLLSFTSAAENLGISRGYLSDQVKQLETELGTALLVRSTRSVKLTKAGENLLQGAQGLRRSLLSLERNLQQDRDAVEGELKITSPTLFLQRFLADICAAFRRQHPDICFNIDASYTSHDLMASNFDIAFRSTSAPPQNMVAKPVLRYRHLCCAAPAYIEKFGKPETPADISAHQCLTASQQEVWRFSRETVVADGWVVLNDSRLLREYALAGEGIVRLPEYALDADMRSGELIAVLSDVPTDEHSIYMIYPQLVYPPVRIKAFIDFVQAQFRGSN